MEVYEYPGYRCGPCPPGLQGNGTHCTDINEVGEGTESWGGVLEGPRGQDECWSEVGEPGAQERVETRTEV